MAGIVESRYRTESGLQSRIIIFPDGLARHITLSGWQWDVYDRTHERVGSEYLPEGAYLHALKYCLGESFNENAHPVRRLDDRLHIFRVNAEHLSRKQRSLPAAARFEHRLRRSLVRMIAVNMPAATGRPKPANDEFPA